MQLTPRYLVSNRSIVVLDNDFVAREFRPVYSRNLEIYKNINNRLQFQLLNQDQKPVDLTLYTPIIVIYDSEKNQVIEKTGTVQDDGSSATNGIFVIEIDANLLQDLDEQFLSYTVFVRDPDGEDFLTYANAHFEAAGVLKLSADAIPGPKPSKQVTSFYLIEDLYYSDAVPADPGLNGNTALHTVAFYTDDYQGSVEIQATLESQPDNGTTWTTIDTVDNFTDIEPTAVNFNGVFTYLRFIADTDPTSGIEKILIRN